MTGQMPLFVIFIFQNINYRADIRKLKESLIHGQVCEEESDEEEDYVSNMSIAETQQGVNKVATSHFQQRRADSITSEN